MVPLSLRALANAYVQNDGQLTGAELATLAKRQAGSPADPQVSALVNEFANPRDTQVIAVARGQIPGAAGLLTTVDGTHLTRRVELANSPDYVQHVDASVAAATGVASRAGNAVQLHVDGTAAFPELHRMIQTAKHTIDMDFYMFETNDTGRVVSQELIAAAKRGVRVNVMVDALMATFSTKVIDEMRANGITVKPFTNGFAHPLLHPSTSATHRKLLLVDGSEGMVGGMNIGESYEKYWHDTMTTVRGPVLGDLYQAFSDNWVKSGGTAPADAIALVPTAAQTAGHDTVAVHRSSPTEHQIASGFHAAIDGAQDHIYMSSPYFIDQPLVDHLEAAAKRGVKVVVVVPTMTDIFIVNWINAARIAEMKAAGITVRTFDTVPKEDRDKKMGFSHAYFAHAKMLTVDGVWSGVGSANASARSQWHNQEVNLGVTSPEFAQDIEQRFFHHDMVTGRVHPAAAQNLSVGQAAMQMFLHRFSQFIPM